MGSDEFLGDEGAVMEGTGGKRMFVPSGDQWTVNLPPYNWR